MVMKLVFVFLLIVCVNNYLQAQTPADDPGIGGVGVGSAPAGDGAGGTVAAESTVPTCFVGLKSPFGSPLPPSVPAEQCKGPYLSLLTQKPAPYVKIREQYHLVPSEDGVHEYQVPNPALKGGRGIRTPPP